MIDYLQSAELNGMGEEDLKSWFDKYPVSGKMIVAICDGCGKERETRFDSYRDMCSSCSHKQYYTDHPEAGNENSLRLKEYWSDQLKRKEMSRIKTQYYIDHPEDADARSKELAEYWADQTHRDEQAERLTEYWSDQSIRDAQSDTIMNSEVHKLSVEYMRGGHDLVGHHIAYDFLRPDTLMVEITRKFHSQIHHPKGCQFGDRGYSLID